MYHPLVYKSQGDKEASKKGSKIVPFSLANSLMSKIIFPYLHKTKCFIHPHPHIYILKHSKC